MKKAQSEIVGFVLIVVIVAIVAVFFLGFYLRRPSERIDNKELVNFLGSLNRYTTNCSVNYRIEPLDISSLSGICYDNENALCLSGENACQVLNSTISELIELSWEEYWFKIYYEEDDIQDSIIELREGECLGNLIGSSQPRDHGLGTIVMNIRVCD